MSLPSLIEMTTLPLFTVVTAPCTFISTAAGASACPSSASCEALSDTSLNPYFLLAQKNRGAISPLSFLSYSLPHCSAFYTISNACCSQHQEESVEEDCVCVASLRRTVLSRKRIGKRIISSSANRFYFFPT